MIKVSKTIKYKGLYYDAGDMVEIADKDIDRLISLGVIDPEAVEVKEEPTPKKKKQTVEPTPSKSKKG